MRLTAITTILVASAIMCSTALATGFWELSEAAVSTNVAVNSKSASTLKFEDTKTPGGAAAMECTVSEEGTVGTAGKGKITAATVSSCKSVKLCEAAGLSAKAVHLPWNTQLEEVEEAGRDKISSSGSGSPGWSFECLVAGVMLKDECTTEITTTGLEDPVSGVDLVYDSKSTHLNCSIGGTGTGVVTGTELDENPLGKRLAAKNTGEEHCSESCSDNIITASATHVAVIPAVSYSANVFFTNHNWWWSWRPLGHTLNVIAGNPLAWAGSKDNCEGHVIARSESCELEIKFASNNEAGRFIAETALDGAPATATVLMEGEI